MSGMRHLVVAALLAAALVATAVAAETYVSPEAAKETFAYQAQGEYRGKVSEQNKKEVTLAMQVIARGDGKFRAVLYKGGLPGASSKVDRGDAVDGKRTDHTVRFEHGSGDVAVLEDGTIQLLRDGEAIGTLKKVHRASPTLGKGPPKGATVLFDGTSADAFKGGEMTEDGLLEEGATSKKSFGDHFLHLEFRLPFKPAARKQHRGNSGLYLQARYEVQMLDSFGLKGRNNECGGIYSVKAPAVNMCYPPLTWQTYDVAFDAAEYDDGEKTRNARMTVWHNGVLIHDTVDVPGPTTAAPKGKGPEAGPVYLQDHGNPVRYRNIWVTNLEKGRSWMSEVLN